MAFQPLPGLSLAWNDVTLAGGDTFQSWNLYRRRTTLDAAYTRIAVLPTRASRTYTDYNVASGQSYDYEVTVQVTRAGTVVESSAGTATRSVTFAANFLHQVGNPTNYLEVKSQQVQPKLTPDLTYRKVWGREKPTAYAGEGLAATFQVQVAASLDTDYSAWNALVTLLEQQRTAGGVFCFRPRYTPERWFVALDAVDRTDDVGTYTLQLNLSEVFFDEGV